MVGKLRSAGFSKNDLIWHLFLAPANWVEDDLLLQVDQASAKKAVLVQQCWQFFFMTKWLGVVAKMAEKKLIFS